MASPGDSRDRYRTCAEFVRRLEAALTAPHSLAAQRWRWVAGAALLLVLAAWTVGVSPESRPGARPHPGRAPIPPRRYALKRDGSVWAWGQNSYGALGDGTWTQRLSPVPVSGLADVASIAAGSQHGLALKRDGSLWTWDWNDYGQLGKESIRVLESAGSMTLTYGAERIFGQVRSMGGNGFPWILFDRNGHRLVLHPGNFGTSQWGAALGFDVPEDGRYMIGGAFQRANSYPNAGDGVDAAVILDTDAAHPLWAGHIASSDLVKKPFSIRKPLLHGQVVRFVVFSGPEGKDGTSDETFLGATIDR